MLILILIDVQYLQNVVFSFEKYLNGQHHSLSDFHHPISPPAKFPIPSHWRGGGGISPLTLNAIWKILETAGLLNLSEQLIR